MKKVITKTRTAVTKKTTAASKATKPRAKATVSGKTKSNLKTTKAKKTASPKKLPQPRSKAAIKLPKIKGAARVRATLPSKTAKSTTDKAQRNPPAKSKASNTLNRPSASTKAKILAAAKKGAGVQNQPKQAKKVEKRTSPQRPTPRKLSPKLKEKKNVASQDAKRASSSGKVVKNVAKKAISTVKSTDKATVKDKTPAGKAHALAGFFSRPLSVF